MRSRSWIRSWAGLLAAGGALALLPVGAGAFSFGSFTPGDTIASIELTSGEVTDFVDFDTGADPSDPSDDVLVLQASVSTITMTGGTVFNIPLGDVLVQSTVMPVGGTELFAQTFLGVDLQNGMVSDIQFVDVADANNVLLAGTYLGGGVTLQLTQSPQVAGIPITGSLSSQFDRDEGAGDASFEAAFGNTASFASTLAGFLVGGVAPSVNCDFTNGIFFGGFCTGATDFASFTAQPTTTIAPLAAPEPGAAVLIGLALGAGLVARRAIP